jgi:hypothetical protein
MAICAQSFEVAAAIRTARCRRTVRANSSVQHLRQAGCRKKVTTEVGGRTAPDVLQRDDLVGKRVCRHTQRRRRPAWLELEDDCARDTRCVLEERPRSRTAD